MYVLSKIKNNIKKYGFIKFLKRACIKISHVLGSFFTNLFCKKRYLKELDKIINKKDYKNIIVQFPFFDFNMPNFQRFQQLAISLSNVNDNLFFYCTPNNIYDKVYGFKKTFDNLYLTNQYNLILNNKDIKRTIIFVSTDLSFSIKDVEDALNRGDKVIYDYVDEMHEHIVGKINEDIIKRHKLILENENVRVIATADKLLEEVKKYRNENYELIGNGVRVEDFRIDENEKTEFYKNNNDIVKEEEFCKNHKVNILYYGVFAKWFDYDLIKYIANKDKEIGIILIGPDYDLSLKNSNLLELENVLYIGLVEYKNLKYFGDNADILTIPFLVNDITNSTSPVKLFEYMAMEKRILTTNLYECKKYKSVVACNNQEEFLEKIYEIKKCSLKENEKQNIINEAFENSWDNKALRFLN